MLANAAMTTAIVRIAAHAGHCRAAKTVQDLTVTALASVPGIGNAMDLGRWTTGEKTEFDCRWWKSTFRDSCLATLEKAAMG
jgi:hypothetical protein